VKSLKNGLVGLLTVISFGVCSPGVSHDVNSTAGLNFKMDSKSSLVDYDNQNDYDFSDCEVNQDIDSVDHYVFNNISKKNFNWPDNHRYYMTQKMLFPELSKLKGNNLPVVLDKQVIPTISNKKTDTAYVLNYNGFQTWEYRIVENNKVKKYISGFNIDSFATSFPYINIGIKRETVRELITPRIACDSSDVFFCPSKEGFFELILIYDEKNKIKRISATYPVMLLCD
jgi:hypothetical protein